MIAIGIWGLASSGFVAVWAPGIQPSALRKPMAVACSLISIFAGGGLLWPRHASMPARVLLAFLCLWLVWCKGPTLIHAPTDPASWESFGETAVLGAAAWAIAARAAKDQTKQHRDSHHDGTGPRVLYGLALIAFGAAHLGYPAVTANLVPPWLPWHLAWVIFTAATYIAAGIVLALGRLVQPAAALSALQMALFGVLIWLPKIVSVARDLDTLNEAAISFALAASGWVIASTAEDQAAADVQKMR